MLYGGFLPEVSSFGDLLGLGPPRLGCLEGGQLPEDALGERRHLDAVLHEDGVDLGLQVPNSAQEFDKVSLGILRADRPGI
jgi:hypothetical protein